MKEKTTNNMVHANLLSKMNIPEEKDLPMREQSDIYNNTKFK